MSIEAKVQRALDTLEIQTLISMYSLGQDSHQGDDGAILEQWDQVFTPDGTIDFSVADAPTRPYRELAMWMRGAGGKPGRMSRYSHWQHMMSIPIIRITGDTARARTDILAIHKVKSAGPKGERFDSCGAFHDDLVRTADGWRIRHRRLEVYFWDAIETHEEKALPQEGAGS